MTELKGKILQILSKEQLKDLERAQLCVVPMYVHLNEVQKILPGIPRQVVIRACARGELPHLRIGRQLYLTAEALLPVGSSPSNSDL